MTPTFTPTGSVTPTLTSTPVLGEGSWSLVPAVTPLVDGGTGYSATLNYLAGPNAWPASGGLLAVYFPLGLDAPSAANFYAAPADAGHVSSYGYNGRTATVWVHNLASGAGINFLYGYNPSGFAVSTTVSPLVLQVSANSLDRFGPVGIVTPNLSNVPMPVVSVTSTSTPTITPTPTISPTFSNSPTVTPTWTESPIGPEQSGTVYSYPNPFDLKKTDKCTFRFPAAASAKLTVFNLLGEPVRQLPDADVNATQGWAVWPGQDDYLRRVTGGIYFVRVTTPQGVLFKKFTVLY